MSVEGIDVQITATFAELKKTAPIIKNHRLLDRPAQLFSKVLKAP